MSAELQRSLPPVRFALVGCGRMGRHHSERMQEDGRGEVVALFDSEPSMAVQLRAERWPAARIAISFHELLADQAVDAVIICTPTAEHYLQTLACLNRGWHVLCEKPLASRRDQILELMQFSETAKSRNQAFSLGYQRRFAPVFVTLRREVLSGKWGAVRAIVSHNVENWQSTIGGTWRDDPQQNPGGFLTDAGSHKLDALFYVTGLKPVEVFARSQSWGSQVEIVTSLSALFTSDVIASDVTVTMDFIGNAQYLGEDLNIHCENADLMLRHEELWIGRDGHRERLPIDSIQSNPVSGILDTILEGKPDRSPPAAALPVFDMTQAILESGRTGTVVRLPPVER